MRALFVTMGGATPYRVRLAMPTLHVEVALPVDIPKVVVEEDHDVALIGIGSQRALNLEEFVVVREHLAHLPKVALIDDDRTVVAKVAIALGAQTNLSRRDMTTERLAAAIEAAQVHHQAQRYSADSEERMRAVFESMSSAVVVSDVATNVVVEANLAAVAILGFSSASELLGRSLEELRPSARPMLYPSPAGERQLVEVSLPNNQRVVIGYSSTLTAAGRQLVTIFRDLTDALEAEERRKRAEQLAQVGEMAARLSHEIKNPLASILSGLQLLELDTSLTEDQRDIADSLLTQARVLSDTIRSLLDQARPAPMTPRPTDVEVLVQTSAETYDSLAQSAGVNLLVRAPESPVEVIADPIWIGRGLSNVVVNAIEATSQGGRVEVSWGSLEMEEVRQRFPGYTGAVAFLRITDEGPGLTQDDLKQVFRPFFTTKQNGTGLGLAVVRDIVEYHGGVIRITSERHRGTAFEILLPAAMSGSLPCWQKKQGCAQDCNSCTLPATSTGFCCWSLRGPALAATGDYPTNCRQCPTFHQTNLTAHATEPLEFVTDRPAAISGIRRRRSQTSFRAPQNAKKVAE